MRRTFVRRAWLRCVEVYFLLVLATNSAIAAPGPDDSGLPTKTEERVPGTVIRLTWRRVLDVVDRNPRVCVSKHQIDAARSGVDAAQLVPNPTLEGTVGQGISRTNGTHRFEWELALSMPLGWLAQRRSRIDVAQADVEVAVAQSQALRRDVLLELRKLFWNLAYEQTRVGSLEAMEAQMGLLVKTIHRRVEAGEARPVEALRVEIELEKVTSELVAARTAHRAREAAMSLWLGVPTPTTLFVEADVTNLPTPLERDTVLTRARTGQPSLAVAQAQSRVFEADVQLEKAARLPSFAVSGFASHELDRRAYGVGLAVDLPLFNWNSARIAQAESHLAASRKHAAAVVLELQSAVLDAQAACEGAVGTALRLRDNVVPRAELTASTMEKTYQLGDVSLLEVLDARRTLLDAHRQHIGAVAQAQIDCSRLRVLLGEESQ